MDKNRVGVINSDYLNRPVTYDAEKLTDSQNRGVMMEWEKPLMEAHAHLICGEGGHHVLNVTSMALNRIASGNR